MLIVPIDVGSLRAVTAQGPESIIVALKSLVASASNVSMSDSEP